MKALSILNEVRVATELAQLRRSPVWDSPPLADGCQQPVVLVCGLFAGDSSMRIIASWLKRGGWNVRKAGIAVNVGCSQEQAERLEKRLEQIVFEAGGHPAILIGHSRGGTFSRVLAVRRPDLVDTVITMGSPLLQTIANVNIILAANIELMCNLGKHVPGVIKHSCADVEMTSPGSSRFAQALTERAKREALLGGNCCKHFWSDLAAPLPDKVKMFSIFSRKDGIIDPNGCIIKDGESIHVNSSHIGFLFNSEAFTEIKRIMETLN